jgi:hypothetical protein
MEDKFISRIDGVDKKRSDYGPTINEANGQIVGQGSIPNLFRTSEEVERAKKIKFAKIAIKAAWNLDHDFLDEVAERFESADECDFYLDILDSESGDREAAWETYHRIREAHGQEPFYC